MDYRYVKICFFLHFTTKFTHEVLYRFEDESIEIHDLCDTYSIWGSMWVMARVNHIGGANVGLAMFTLFFVVLAPIIRSICCLCLWFIPMRAAKQRMVAGAINLLSAVAGAEVFGVACLLMTWQLPKMFEHMEEAAKVIGT